MTNEWRRFRWGPWPADSRVPGTPPDEATRAEMELPRTLRPVPGEDVLQRPVFDPALKHYARAMKAGDPAFAHRDAAVRWYAARDAAFGHVLEAVAESEWADHLVLRGSVLLASWFGAGARPPGDLDFVVVPRNWKLEDERTDRMLADLARLAERVSRSGAGDVLLSADEAVSDEIWTYDRVPGRRLVLPWRAEGVPAGSVQLDFVFGERLAEPPSPTLLHRSEGEPLTLLAATPEQSLAWKVLWLVEDMYPRAKDLYDAMLLAEAVTVDARLLHRTFTAADDRYATHPPSFQDLLEAVRYIDWEEFSAEYPEAPPVADPGAERLLDALLPAFAEPLEPAEAQYERRMSVLERYVENARRVLAEQGREAFHRDLAAGRLRITDAALVANEVLERPVHDLETTAWELLDSPEWPRRQADLYRRHPRWLEADLARLSGVTGRPERS
ncbi:nucleotidyl transferase AbiEii/AbiGii toxin family protein [Actinocorallia populi]|uniref:nucleotidyl transferase AbiEii/AbiGii toxin family protein n=1 Tax=Actinocorallia populi TaxID=2079200 RepID=UPI000D08FDFD|nr:nucleotidyl transferase AbiEii/AbiGii toxin family protein [Actinocorallia populi]